VLALKMAEGVLPRGGGWVGGGSTLSPVPELLFRGLIYPTLVPHSSSLPWQNDFQIVDSILLLTISRGHSPGFRLNSSSVYSPGLTHSVRLI